MHTGYTLIQPYVFLTLNSLLTNEHLLSSPADLFCYEFSGDVSLKFVASPYTELIIGQRPDGSCRILYPHRWWTVDTKTLRIFILLWCAVWWKSVLPASGTSVSFSGWPAPDHFHVWFWYLFRYGFFFRADTAFSFRIKQNRKNTSLPARRHTHPSEHQKSWRRYHRQRTGCAYRLFLSPYQPHFYGIFRIQPENLLPAVTLSPYSLWNFSGPASQ